MIQILKQIREEQGADKLNEVLLQLFIKGKQSGREYCRYSYQQLDEVANWLQNFEYAVDVEPSSVDKLLKRFNSIETHYFKQIINRSPAMREGLSKEVRQSNQRTRQYVQSLLAGKETTPQKKKNGMKALGKLNAFLS